MSSSVLEQIIDQVRQLPVDQRIEVARAIDQLTWRERWQAVEDRVNQRGQQETITDEEIDEIVREVRRERPLHQRS